MLDLKTIRTLTLDASDTYSDGAMQDQAAELILRMLTQNYQIYVFSSNPKHSVAFEDFEHPALRFLREPMPPAPELAARFPDLTSRTNLWITDDPDLAVWLIGGDLPLATRKAPPAAGVRYVLRYRTLGELASALDPATRVFAELSRLLAALDAARQGPPSGRVIGIGGPPLAGQPDFALALKRFLESEGQALVELLDLSALGLGTAGAADREEGPAAAARRAEWLAAQFEQMKAGRPVYHETLPEGLPRAFEPHLPLFWSPESVILAFGEMTFQPPLLDLFDLTVLLENTPNETTRRIYEIEDNRFDTKFTEQYLAHEGKAYERYLTENAVRERVNLRIDSNTPGAYFLVGPEPTAAGERSS